jgi:hypothetical protein
MTHLRFIGLAALAPLCLHAQPVPAINLSTRYAQMLPGQSLALTASVSGGGSQSVVWEVNNFAGGTAATGTITASGTYTAPAAVPANGSVTVDVVSLANPMIRATATITLLAQAPKGTTYYVAKTGKDTNPGTLASPFATIQHAADVAVAGDTVLVRQGIYNALVTPAHSGNSTAGYITFESYPAELATIDGTSLPIPGGMNGLLTLNNASYVIFEGFELRNYTTAKITQVPLGIYLTGGGTNVQIVNNHIHNITTTAPTTPAQCGSDAFGFAAYGTAGATPIANLVVSGNEVNANKTGCSETVTLNGNVTGFTVSGNLVHNNNNIGMDAIGFEHVSSNPATDQARMGTFRGNTVFAITSYGNPDYGAQYSSDGIYVDGGTNIVIEQNLIHHVDLGIELASEMKGHVTSNVIARNNVIFSDNSNGISIGGYGANRGGTQNCRVVNNTLFADDTKNTGSGEFQIQFNASANLFANNIAYATRQGILLNGFTKNTAPPATLNNNLYFSPLGTANSQWVSNGHTYTGFASYQTTGLDAASHFANPAFTRTAAPPLLTLTAGSPGLTGGADLGPAVMGTADFSGQKRTVGVGAFSQ